MNLLRRIAALPLALVLLWTMAFAPYAVARCEHACGETHLHALGAACADDDRGDCGEDHGDSSGPHGDAPDCKPFKADDATAGDFAPVKIKAPVPADLPPPAFFRIVAAHANDASGIHAHRPNAPPARPPAETHGRGALPLLS